MTVGASTNEEGRLLSSTTETPNGNEEIEVVLAEQYGVIHANLKSWRCDSKR